MRTTLETIFDTYRKADFIDRQYMFLQFRELRNDFLEIDQKDMGTDFFGTAGSPCRSLNPIGRIIKRCFSFLS